jgi:hypothetical protein
LCVEVFAQPKNADGHGNLTLAEAATPLEHDPEAGIFQQLREFSGHLDKLTPSSLKRFSAD